jgi:hypothetical protein
VSANIPFVLNVRDAKINFRNVFALRVAAAAISTHTFSSLWP